VAGRYEGRSVRHSRVAPRCDEQSHCRLRNDRGNVAARRKGVQDVRVQLPHLLASEQRPDVLLDIAPVGVKRALVELSHLQVTVEQLTDSDVGARVASLIDLGEQPGSNLLCLTIRPRSRRNRLTEVVVASCQRIDACINTNAVAAAWQLLDTSACPRFADIRPRHGPHSTRRSCHEPCHATVAKA
jgi:hypothetical protein